MSNYPAGAEGDPNAPWLQTEEEELETYEIIVETRYRVEADDVEHAQELWMRNQIDETYLLSEDVVDIIVVGDDYGSRTIR